jgi:hypothetical protein
MSRGFDWSFVSSKEVMKLINALLSLYYRSDQEKVKNAINHMVAVSGSQPKRKKKGSWVSYLEAVPVNSPQGSKRSPHP